MNIVKDYPKYTIYVDPKDIATDQKPIGKSRLTEDSPIVMDISKMDGIDERPSDEEVYKMIANSLGLNRAYVKAHFYPELMTWQRFKEFVDQIAPDYVEISSIEVHNYGGKEMSISAEKTHDDKLIIHQGQ